MHGKLAGNPIPEPTSATTRTLSMTGSVITGAAQVAGVAVGLAEGSLYGSLELVRFGWRQGLFGVLFGSETAAKTRAKGERVEGVSTSNKAGNGALTINAFSMLEEDALGHGAAAMFAPATPCLSRPKAEGDLIRPHPAAERLVPLLRELQRKLTGGGGEAKPKGFDSGAVDSFMLDDLSSDWSSEDDLDDE